LERSSLAERSVRGQAGVSPTDFSALSAFFFGFLIQIRTCLVDDELTQFLLAFLGRIEGYELRRDARICPLKDSVGDLITGEWVQHHCNHAMDCISLQIERKLGLHTDAAAAAPRDELANLAKLERSAPALTNHSRTRLGT
jgi:hypothetical protein